MTTDPRMLDQAGFNEAVSQLSNDWLPTEVRAGWMGKLHVHEEARIEAQAKLEAEVAALRGLWNARAPSPALAALVEKYDVLIQRCGTEGAWSYVVSVGDNIKRTDRDIEHASEAATLDDALRAALEPPR